MEGVLTPLQQKIKERAIQLKLPIWLKNAAIFTDQHSLKQVIYNLLLNAIDASNKCSPIDIKLELTTQELILQLMDRGCGMPFTPGPSAVSAPTTKRFGTGIWVQFAFKVCGALGGKLKFKARIGGGAVITTMLPKALNLQGN